jgi:predicted RNA-binding Zn-ribbon protein involved in translation (DUF1610 family)
MAIGRAGVDARITCPRCGRRTEFVIERNMANGVRKIAYMHICSCGWRSVSEIYITKRDGSIVLARARGKTSIS